MHLQQLVQLLPLLQLCSTFAFWSLHKSEGTDDNSGADVATGHIAEPDPAQSCHCGVV